MIKTIQKIKEVPGIGSITAAETIAAIDTGKQSKNGRPFAAWLGLTSKYYASGKSCHMGKISKRGNKRLARSKPLKRFRQLIQENNLKMVDSLQHG